MSLGSGSSVLCPLRALCDAALCAFGVKRFPATQETTELYGDFGQTAINGPLLLLDENILPPHLHSSTGVNLQAYHAIGEFWRRVGIVHDLHSIELRHDVIALDGHCKLIPLAGSQRLLAFRRRHLHPSAPAAFI